MADALPELALPVRQLVEFLLRSGSIDSRFTGFDRANEGARIHRRLQKSAGKEHPGYAAEVALKQQYTVAGIRYTVEGRADGVFPAPDGVTVIDEIKTTAVPAESITEDFAPEHWAQGQVYAAIYALQQNLPRMRVQLTYYQVDEELTLRFARDYTAGELQAIVQDLLERYAPWARRAAQWRQDCRANLRTLRFPFAEYRPGQRALTGEVYRTCREGGQLLCQAPTGIGKTMSVLFPALKAMGETDCGPVFYLTARGTTRAAAENALDILRRSDAGLKLRSITLTAKDKICLCERRECTPDACPYAKGYYARIKDALWAALEQPSLTAETLQDLAGQYTVCPFELGLDLSLWCDVIVGDYNYLFDPVVCLRRFFETKGDYLFLIDEAHNLPGRAREMHSASLTKSAVFGAKKKLGKGKSRLKTALGKINEVFVRWRHVCEQAEGNRRTVFLSQRDEEFDKLLTRLCQPLEDWLDEHREPDEIHETLLQLYFDVRAWLRVADTFDDHFVLQLSAWGSEVKATQLCLDPSAFLAQDFAKGRAAVLFSATLSPAGYYRDLCGVPQSRAVALRSPFDPHNLGLFCLSGVSTRYKDRTGSLDMVADALAAMVQAQTGNYFAFFPSYSYLESVYEHFCARWPEIDVLRQEPSMDETQRAAFLGAFTPAPVQSLLGFGVLGGVFGEGVDLAGDRLIGAAVIGPGLPQVNPVQEQLRDYFETTRGRGFDYAYRFPGMNKVLQAAGRVIRTPQDKGVVLLIDGRFAQPDYRRLMPPHWEHLTLTPDRAALARALESFWKCN
ncbi:MAG: ATP-dependent DNA helicase [Gemmiger sp.]